MDYAESMADERGGNRIIEAYLKMKNPYTVKLSPKQFTDNIAEAPSIRYAKEHGHDGVIFEYDGSKEDLDYDKFYVVFDSAQIKSATDNIGTFDKTNPDIRYSSQDGRYRDLMGEKAVKYTKGILCAYRKIKKSLSKTGEGFLYRCTIIPITPFTKTMRSDTRLFKDTLLNNIKAARPDATREEVLKAADEAQCKDIIDRLPDGLDTLVGTGGTYLSGGENQRIALARAILKDAPIIVLDEATAFADAENEHQIQLAFERLTQNKTVLMIAHRLSTIQDADLILVFKEGQIAERGTHEELVALNGIYSSMWKDYQTSIAWKVGKEDEQHD